MPRKKKEEKEKKAKKGKAEKKTAKRKKTVKTKKETVAKKTEKKKTARKAKKAVKGAAVKKKSLRYWEGVGRRKTAVARVRISTKKDKGFLVNEKKIDEYFSLPHLIQKAISPLEKINLLEKFSITVRVRGGGVFAQAEAVRHGLSRALIKFNENFRKPLKKEGFLTRDPRMKERKKFGLKRARRAPQWQKR